MLINTDAGYDQWWAHGEVDGYVSPILECWWPPNRLRPLQSITWVWSWLAHRFTRGKVIHKSELFIDLNSSIHLKAFQFGSPSFMVNSGCLKVQYSPNSMQSISSNVHLYSMFIQCPVLVFTDSNQASWILIAFLVLLSSLSLGGLVVSIFVCQPKGRGIEPRREPKNFLFIFKCSRIPSVRKFLGRSR